MKTVAFHTLGCKLNFSESSSISRMFEDSEYRKVGFSEKADVYVINTCSVTANADKECRQIVKSALNKSPDAFIVVIGCYAQLKPDEISNISGVDLVLGASEKFQLLKYLDNMSKKEIAEVHNCEIENVDSFESAFSANDRTRSFLKVQDGCDYNCSFCTIPLARGKSRSDSIDNVIENINKIAGKGVKEVVLTGINLGDFGKTDSNESRPTSVNTRQESFYKLLRNLNDVTTIERFRISSIEPNLLSDEIISFVGMAERIVHHFHIPLQSGSDNILRLMKRRYNSKLYRDRVIKIKQEMPDCCIGVDVIVGFPGETEDDFLTTYNFLNALDISYLHVFTYSERDNTEAKNLEGVVPIEIRKKRNKMLRILSAKKQRQFYTNHLNDTRPVLFEGDNKNGFMHGFTDNYIKVKTPFNPDLVNQLIKVKLDCIDVNDGTVNVLQPLTVE